MFNDTFFFLPHRSSSFSLNITMQTPTKFLRVPFGGKWQEIFFFAVKFRIKRLKPTDSDSDFSHIYFFFFNDNGLGENFPVAKF